MTHTASETRVEAMLRELLDRQRRCDERLEALECSLERLAPTTRPVVVDHAVLAKADTVPMARMKTPPMIGWSTREEPPLPELVTPTMNRTRSGGVIQTPPPRRLPKPSAETPQVSFRPPAPAAFSSTPPAAPIASSQSPRSSPDDLEIAKLETLLAESERRRRSADEQLAKHDKQVADLENQLLQSRRLETIGRFVAGIAHDFNNLLTLICGNAEMIRDGLSESDPQRDAALQVVSAGQSAAGLTRQLLTLARPTASEPRPLDLNMAVHAAEKMIRRLIGEDLNLTVHLAPSIEIISADPLQVEQVLFNLAANARDAITGGAGSVVIRTADATIEPNRPGWPAELPPGSYVALTISDTGCGMSEEVKSKIFDPFFTTKPGSKGIGLGMANVRETMRLAGGHVEVESSVGWGTSIRLYWPRLASFTLEARDEPIVPLAPQTLGRGETVLIVEDDRPVRDLLCVTLQQAGYRVFEAADAEAAEERARLFAGPISLLIADIGLRGCDGLQLAAKLRANRPGLRVLYISGYAAPEAVAAEPHSAFLSKPYTPRKLLEVVRAAIGMTRQD